MRSGEDLNQSKMKQRKAVFIVVGSIKNNKPEYLILKRKLHWKGWEFPKGGVEFLETKKMAVKRELFEETGLRSIRIKKFSFSGSYDYEKSLPDRKGFIGQEFSLYFAEVEKSKVKIDKKEHSGFRWVSFPVAFKSLEWPNQKISLKIVNDWLKEESHQA